MLGCWLVGVCFCENHHLSQPKIWNTASLQHCLLRLDQQASHVSAEAPHTLSRAVQAETVLTIQAEVQQQYQTSSKELQVALADLSAFKQRSDREVNQVYVTAQGTVLKCEIPLQSLTILLAKKLTLQYCAGSRCGVHQQQDSCSAKFNCIACCHCCTARHRTCNIGQASQSLTWVVVKDQLAGGPPNLLVMMYEHLHSSAELCYTRHRNTQTYWVTCFAG